MRALGFSADCVIVAPSGNAVYLPNGPNGGPLFLFGGQMKIGWGVRGAFFRLLRTLSRPAY